MLISLFSNSLKQTNKSTVKIIDNINKSLRDYKLFIGSLNSTTLIQAFLSGIPSIHFLNDSYFLPKNNYSFKILNKTNATKNI